MRDTRALGFLAIIAGFHIVVQLTLGAIPTALSRDPGFAAHQLCFLVGMLFCAVYGSWLWFDKAAIIEDRIYGLDPGALLLAEFSAAFQFYDLVSSLMIDSLRLSDRIGHHVIASILGFWSYHHGILLYYALFFFGVSEVSSVFLAFVDFFKEFAELRNPRQYPLLAQLNEVTRNIFACVFLTIRVCYWPYVSIKFWADALDALKHAKPHPIEITCIMLANIGLTLLQFYWAFLILKQIYKKFGGVTIEEQKEEAVDYGSLEGGKKNKK